MSLQSDAYRDLYQRDGDLAELWRYYQEEIEEQLRRDPDCALAMAADRAADPHPDCPDQYHGADGGACQTCGWDSHPVTAGEA